MKAYTDLQQSKMLADILPLESADMSWVEKGNAKSIWYDAENRRITTKYEKKYYIPCWSLAALLGVLPKKVEIEGQHYVPCLFPVQNKWLLKLWYNSNYTITSPVAIFSDNPIDAYYEMILKLNEQKLL